MRYSSAIAAFWLTLLMSSCTTCRAVRWERHAEPLFSSGAYKP